MHTKIVFRRLSTIMVSTVMAAALLAGCHTAEQPGSSVPDAGSSDTASAVSSQTGVSSAPASSPDSPQTSAAPKPQAPTAGATSSKTASTTAENPAAAGDGAFLRANSYDSRDVFVVTVDATKAPYHADNTGKTDATQAIQQAINRCQTNYGGGIVFLPKGTYKVSDVLNVKQHVILKGEYQSPDKAKGDYGTVIAADTTKSVFQMNGASGVSGVTVYYPKQSASKPVECDYTFTAKTGNFTIENVTLLNSYKGVGVCVDGQTAHGLVTIDNLQGTVLKQGLSFNYGSEVSVADGVRLSPSYWAGATAKYGAPSAAAISSWMAANSDSGVYLAGVEDLMLSNSLLDGFKAGLRIGKTPRKDGAESYPQLYNVEIKNADVAADLQYTYVDMGALFANCTLNGRSQSVNNASSNVVKLFNCTTGGAVSGNVAVSSASVNPPAPSSFASITPPAKNKLYNVVADYGADNGGKADCSAAIQKALDAAKADGGGYVYLPGGMYRLDKPITVYANTELCGSNAVPGADVGVDYAGTSIFSYYGKGLSATDTALITLAGKGAGCTGIRIYYPLNGVTKENGQVDNSVEEYSYAVRGTAANVYCRNLNFYAASRGIEMSGADNYVIRRCIGSFYKNGIRVQNCKGGLIDACLANNGQQTGTAYLYLKDFKNWLTDGNEVRTYIIEGIGKKNHDYLTFQNSTGQVVFNTFSYIPRNYLVASGSEISALNVYTSRMGSQNAMYTLNGGKLLAINNFLKDTQLVVLSGGASAGIYNIKGQLLPASVSEENFVQ